jgi:hypothetical protein
MSSISGVSTTPSYVAIMVSRRCNMSCGHCSVESSPHLKGEPSETELLGYVRQAAAAGVRSLQLTGGEPMLREKVVLRLLRECKRLGLVTQITTNGFWGKSLDGARRYLKALRRAGLRALTVSYDRYHAEFQGPQAALNIARAAEEQAFSINVNVVRELDEASLSALVTPFQGVSSVRLRFYDMQTVGRAREFAADTLRSEVGGFCSAASFPAITDDARVTACNGPSYFSDADSPLIVGSLRDASLPELFARHQQDPILDTIRTFGPIRLREELLKSPGFEHFPFRQDYRGLCDLCLHITSNKEAVQALYSRLVEPHLVAERFAARKIIESSRKEGPLRRSYVNGAGACRVLLKAMREPQGDWEKEAEQVLGRADLDWRHQAEYLSSCGLARPLLSTIEHSAMTRWAPQFFVEHMQKRAMRDGLRELMQREALRQLGDVLREVKGTGVLLKGAARLALTSQGVAQMPVRATGDLDVYIEPSLAPIVRKKLLDAGWKGEVHGVLPATHHLAPVSFHGIPLEIHTRIMPAFWGLPESELLAHVRKIPEMDTFATLDPEGFLLHSVVHVSTHLFAQGMKTAWDTLWVMEQDQQLDWARLARWVDALRVPRGFWTPLHVLSQELDIPLPQELLHSMPNDARQRRLEVIARHRLFQTIEGPEELNPVSRNAIFFLLHDSWMDRARYVVSWLQGRATKSQGDAKQVVGSRDVKVLRQSVRQALAHWRQYRQALAHEK